MNKFLFIFLAGAILLMMGCAPRGLTPEEQELFGEGSAVAGQAIALGCKTAAVRNCDAAPDRITSNRIVAPNSIQVTPLRGRAATYSDRCSGNVAFDFSCTSRTQFTLCRTQCESAGQSCQDGGCVCQEQWICEETGPCQEFDRRGRPSYYAYRFRACRDQNSCGTTLSRPETFARFSTWEECERLPAGCFPETERCDSRDNDCDSSTDEGELCPLGQFCRNGRCETCTPDGAEVCDGNDNDCDGQVDGFSICTSHDQCGIYTRACTENEICRGGQCLRQALSSWRFDEGSGAEARDSSGINHGQVAGAVWTTGISGTALQFDGNDYVDLGTAASIDRAPPLSIAVWAKWTETQGNARDMINIGAGSNKYALSTGFHDEGQDKVAFGQTATGWKYNVGSRLNDGNWHFLVAIISGTNTVQIYVDGVASQNFPTGDRIYGQYNRIGQGHYGSYIGTLDNLEIYDRVLTASEVQALYAARGR